MLLFLHDGILSAETSCNYINRPLMFLQDFTLKSYKDPGMNMPVPKIKTATRLLIVKFVSFLNLFYVVLYLINHF